jgi:hypothetical protein
MSHEMTHSKIGKLRIADPHFVFRGLTYGDWAGVWLNHLFSDKPDVNYFGGKGMAFLRGNLQYAFTQDPSHAVFSSITQGSALRIQEDTAVFVPVVNTKFVIGSEYQGQTMKDQISMRNTARRDTVNGGPIGVRIRDDGDNTGAPLVNDLNGFYTESPLFTLTIPETSEYKGLMETPIEAGVYQCITVGIFVIISHWPKGRFRLSVFGTGVGTYLTKSLYEIVVTGEAPPLDDISKIPTVTGHGKAPDPMDFVANWNSAKPTK